MSLRDVLQDGRTKEGLRRLRPALFVEMQTDWLSPHPRPHPLFIMWAFSHLFLPTDSFTYSALLSRICKTI